MKENFLNFFQIFHMDNSFMFYQHYMLILMVFFFTFYFYHGNFKKLGEIIPIFFLYIK